MKNSLRRAFRSRTGRIFTFVDIILGIIASALKYKGYDNYVIFALLIIFALGAVVILALFVFFSFFDDPPPPPLSPPPVKISVKEKERETTIEANSIADALELYKRVTDYSHEKGNHMHINSVAKSEENPMNTHDTHGVKVSRPPRWPLPINRG
jgi:hypothetical protein